MIMYGSSDHLPAIQISGSNLLLNIFTKNNNRNELCSSRSTYAFNEVHKYSTDHKIFIKINKINIRICVRRNID